jgi:hypothetical protein
VLIYINVESFQPEKLSTFGGTLKSTKFAPGWMDRTAAGSDSHAIRKHINCCRPTTGFARAALERQRVQKRF